MQKNVLAIQNFQESHVPSLMRVHSLKKRLLVPAWWVEGLIFHLGTKEAWFQSIAAAQLGKTIAVSNGVNLKNIVPLCSIWHEVISKSLCESTKDDCSLQIELNKFLTGTQSEISNLCSQIESILASPLQLCEVKTSKKTKALQLSKNGFMSFVRRAQIEYNVDKITLHLTLSQSCQELCNPSELTSALPRFISINPVVIQSMGTRSNKKLLNYLFLETFKQDAIVNKNNGSSFYIENNSLASFHKEVLNSAPLLYDHGVLGWNNSAPNIKISELKKQKMTHDHITSDKMSGSIYFWQLSAQTRDACELESTISQKILENQNQNELLESQSESDSTTLFPEPPADQLKLARAQKRVYPRHIERPKERSIKRAATRFKEPNELIITKKPKEKPPTLFDDISTSQTLFKSQVPNTFALTLNVHKEPAEPSMTDNEFMICVSEFYESLKPIQKKVFERERKGMSTNQFRSYMMPILLRKKAPAPTSYQN